MRHHLTIVVILCLTGLLAACTSAGAPKTLKIGLAAPFEGLHRPLGYEALFGVKLALQECNAAGGIHGYQVELVALNDFDDPAEAQLQARALVADPDVMGVVGHLSAETTAAAVPVYQKAQLAVVIPWSSAITPTEGIVSVAANLTETADYLETVSKKLGFNNMIEFSDTALTTIPDQTQALSLSMEGVTAGNVLLALQQTKQVYAVFGQVDAGSPQTVQVAQTAADGLIYVSPGPDPQTLPQAAAFIKAYQSLAGFAPGPRAVLAYDAAHVLLDGIEQSLRINNNQPTRAEINAGMNKVQRSGLSGDIAFDSQGWRVNAPVWVYQITAGVYPGTPLIP